MKPRTKERSSNASPSRSGGGAIRMAFDLFDGRYRFILAAIVAGLFTTASVWAASPPLPMLLSTPAASSAGPAVSKAKDYERWVAREKPVSINFEHLDPQSGKAPTEITVELFDGQVLTIQLNRLEQRSQNNYTWHGRVLGYGNSHAVLTVVNGQMAGSIVLFDNGSRTGTTYQIQSALDGTQTLRRIDQNAFPQDHPPGGENLHVPPAQAKKSALGADTLGRTSTMATASAAADSGAVIDVMVVYSNQVAAAAGSAIGAQIQQAVDTANTAYANSGIATRLRLVHYQQVSYDESGDFNTDLNRVTTAGDGYMDDVPALRNTYGADLVSLFVENPQYCGLAWVGPSSSYAFSVVNRGCASGNYSFVHELGHNFGALHDPYVDPGTSPYAFGHGLTDPAQGWRTVMAYNNACAAAGTSCARIAYFSNPNLTYGSPADPLGTASTSDNARVHNQNAYNVANFRLAAAGGCTYTLAPPSANVGATSSSGSFSVTAGTGCAWNTLSSVPWLTIGAGSGTTDSGNVSYAVAANEGPARSGTLTVGNQLFTVNQASGCTYTLSPTSANVAAGGGTGTVTLTTGAACTWNASSTAGWLAVSSTSSGSGNATVTYSVAANANLLRSANLTIGGATFMVTEAAATVTPSATATLSSTSLNFGNQKVGTTSAAKTVTVTNSGGGTLTISSMTSGGTNPDAFAGGGTCATGTALTGGQNCTIQYTFTPGVMGSLSATLAVATSAGPVNLSLSGRGSRK